MTKCPDDSCRQLIVDTMRRLGCEVAVSSKPPLVANPYVLIYAERGVMSCPHGVAWWVEPTSDQQAQWAKDGVL